MIEKMKHAYIVCRRQERAATVDRLGELGIVHVVDVQPAQSSELEDRQSEASRVEDVLNALHQYQPEDGGEGLAEPMTGEDGQPPELLTRRVLKLLDQLEAAEEEEAHWSALRDRIEPWGGFSRSTFDRLTDYGLALRLAAVPAKESLPELPEEAMVWEVNRDRRRRYLLLAAPAGIELPEQPTAFVPPAETDLSVIARKVEEAREKQEQTKAQLRQHSPTQPVLADYLRRLRSAIEFARARAGMGEAEAVCYLRGYIPAGQQEPLRVAAQRHGWGLLLQEPAKDDPHIPTKIRLARWVEPIRLVFQAMGIMPGYWEIDISAWFMVFLSIFFAILFGDAGYGALFLVLTLVLRKVFPKAPSQPFWLFGIFSASTIAWGVMAGTYFGIQVEPDSALGFLRVEALTKEANVQKLCFLLGAIHLTIAHAWNAMIYGRSLKPLSEIAWIAVLWGNYYLAQVLVLGIPQPPLMLPLYAVGLAGIVLFSNPDRNPLRLIGGGVGALLLGLVNSFVDVVSYIRLYAVGAATVAVAESFNHMAWDFLPSWGTFLVGAAILLLGHGLNVVLGLMSVLVHGVRLNVLEFSQHLGLQWSGNAYRPLQRLDSETGESN